MSVGALQVHQPGITGWGLQGAVQMAGTLGQKSLETRHRLLYPNLKFYIYRIWEEGISAGLWPPEKKKI